MKKLQALIDNAYYNGKLPKGCTIHDFRVIEWIYEGLQHSANSCFIENNVKKVLESCGIACVACGIGYQTDYKFQ